MLSEIGAPSVPALFDSIPKDQQLGRPLNFGRGWTEPELQRELKKRAGQPPVLSFLGAGATPHFVPVIVGQLLLRSEWYTSYTPYQPEMAQGTLQAIFEFQTLAADLYGCEIANASMYDGATAMMEAVLMAKRVKRKGTKIFVSKAVHPEYRHVLETYLVSMDLEVVEIDFDATGLTSCQQLEEQIDKHGAESLAIVYQTPNFLGQVEEQKSLIAKAKAKDLMVIAVNTDPAALGAIQSPGKAGADIVVGEGIGFCGHTSLGAPGVGLFATKQKYVRQMPGRLAGVSVDVNGQRGFVLTLSTREQHIRRDKATSNICSNHGLMALAFSIAMTSYGKTGFQQLAKQNISRCQGLVKKWTEVGGKTQFGKRLFNETVLSFDTRDDLLAAMDRCHAQDIFPGVDMQRFYPEMDRHLMVSTTELHLEEDLDTLVGLLKGGAA
jgi:glycine dehydrogenase subunit 1